MHPPCPTVRRGLDLMQAGKLDQAEQILRRHLLKEPRDATANHILAATLLSKGQHAQAIFFATKANELFPHDYAILSVLGTALTAAGDAGPAIGIYREATHLAPDKPTLWSGLGVTLLAEDRLDEAIVALDKAVELDPMDLSCAINLAVCHTRLGDSMSSLRVLHAALQRHPTHEALLLHAAAVSNYVDTLAPAAIRAAHDSLARAIEAPAKSVRHMPASPLNGRPLRVGFLSSDFYNHSCSYFLEPLLAHFAEPPARASSAIDLVCFSSTHDNDHITRRLKAFGHPWRDVLNLSNQTCADAIRSDRIDVLIDCGGYTHDTRVRVLAYRAAPVQMTYLGYPNTTALKECDYRIVDSITDPPGSDALSSETLIRLDPHFLCYIPLRADRGVPIDPTPPSARTGTITFASFNAVMKVVDGTIRAWADLLRAVPGSRLLLKCKHPGARRRIAKTFQAEGIDPARVQLLEPVFTAADHMMLYNDVDVALDPFPYNGTTTTFESLSMGVPVVALLGDRHAARVSASILSAAGLPDLVAPTVDQYVSLAASLARNTDRLAAWRRDLRSQLVASPACDAAAFSTRFARALHAAWDEKVAAST